jgi:uncharacterized repeat protein (TIGR03803 family)
MCKKAVFLIAIAFFLSISVLATPTENILYTFSGGTDGAFPYSGLIADDAGNLYGTTQQGGDLTDCGGCGTVFELSSSGNGWTKTILYSFTGISDGDGPDGGLVFDRQGNLYGTTTRGNNAGTVYELSPSNGGWTETVLYRFGYTDGYFPTSTLIFDKKGNLYGTTEAGGGQGSGPECVSGCGTVFELSPTDSGWKEAVLYRFTGASDGANPLGSLVMDAAGNLYGTTLAAGNFKPYCGFVGCGVVFELTPSDNSWAETVLHEFSARDGGLPFAGLTFDGKGNLFGTAEIGGTHGDGVVYELSRSASVWTENVIYSFCAETKCKDGTAPESPVTFDGKGNIYGTTYGGGTGYGTVFKLFNNNGVWTRIGSYAFNGSDGGDIPTGGVLLMNGFLFGTTYHGGNTQACGGCGVVYQLAQ